MNNDGWTKVADGVPDSDETVLIHHAQNDDPVWMGYLDTESGVWRDVHGACVPVSHWRRLPEPPCAG